ncbi:MAG TPA: type II toxin-antitoxin system RelE/ParE family toxin [Thermoanaerobaculia bacterium]|nr:type II toxin-antitoxin system RelE/ParE family toxin [Thermoanaerobaculia bacterium]
MIERVIIRPLAKQDIREARAWYREISAFLAEDFVDAVDDAIELARDRPLAFQLVHRAFRRVLLRRFPYALFYYADESRLVIVAVLHQARDPRTLQER